ncbi:hypothetical protein AVDCRST_MAG94-5265 [uncultured Leptolyngbya sp.]|uniref:Uncharacterized protein n=1 Tax=uncultured Leptolyngbya sp. TaxID=332963 RepID=A0A6J4NNE3_9CYAN|nr:hypothetical protein AVDCRST_MAG94-5265 [uncultured Leptolyngbya sp.]
MQHGRCSAIVQPLALYSGASTAGLKAASAKASRRRLQSLRHEMNQQSKLELHGPEERLDSNQGSEQTP